MVFYELLQKHLLEELVKLSVFLHANSTILDVWCTVLDQEGSYHREKPEWFVSSTLFTDHMKAAIHKEIETVYKLITEHDLPSYVRENFDMLYRKRPFDSN